jgi:5-methylcytosine-specific restriction endonuclease McrBC regulatory subunit McrC
LPPVLQPARIAAELPLRAPPQFDYYDEALDIASRLASGYGHGQTSGPYAGYGYLIGMERTFEAFVESTLRVCVANIPGRRLTTKPQASKLYALAQNPDINSYFTRPDNLLVDSTTGNSFLLVDAKYKSLTDAEEDGSSARPKNSDLYQLFASLVSHGCLHGLLLYPRLMGQSALDDGQARFWRVDSNGQTYWLAAATVNVGQADSLRSLAELDHSVTDVLATVIDKAAD